MRFHGTLRIALAFAALLGSLSLVVWRQSRSMEALRELDGLRNARAAMESERSRHTQRIQYLESRSRILEVAGTRWGMRVPVSGEAFVLKMRPDLPVPRAARRLLVAAADAGQRSRD